MKKWFFFFFPFLLIAQENFIPAAGNPNVIKTQEILVQGFTLIPGGMPLDQVKREPGIHILIEHKKNDQELIAQLEQYLHQPLTDSLISKVRKTIIDFYRERQGLYVAAIIPVQKIIDNVILIQILEGHIGKIEYQGQKWFSKRTIANALGVKPGDPVIESEFLNDVTWANRNPFRHIHMVLVPGTQKEETNLLFITKDRFPVRFYAGSDNTGFQSNGVYRLYAGFNWGNAFRLGDLLSYQYTASTNFHSFQSHVFNYTSFLPSKHLLSIFGTYGIVFPNITGFSVEGKDIQASFRYQIPIRPLYGSIRQQSEFGFDWKYLTTNLFFVGDVQQTIPANQTITITQFMSSYKLERNWIDNLLTFRMDMFLSLWKDWIFPFQTSGDYNIQRAGSQVRFAYWKSALSHLYVMKRGVTISGQVRGQLATGALPTAEQFGLGGMNTVRGYYEQQFVADDAICINLEAYTPKMSLFKKAKDQLSFLVFIDYGFGYNYVATSPEFISQNLLGLGPGIRYDILPYLNCKLDYGFQIIALPQDQRFGRFHFSVNASY